MFDIEEDKEITFTILEGGVAHLSINDYLYYSDDNGSVQAYVDKLNEIKRNPDIRGLVLEVYSGGGQDTASDYIGNAVAALSAVKPVVVYGHTLASGAYLMAVNANIIVASSGLSRIGSIGSYIPLDRFYRDIYSTYMQDVYAEQSTEKNADFREWISDERVELYQKRANASADYFISKVRMKRPYVSEDAYKGGLYDAEQAKKMGLIDGVGTLDYALSRALSLLNNY